MASVMSHELEESISDPNLNAWYDSSGNENADKCAWTFGSTYSFGGAVANMKLGTKDFLIQQNWLNANGGGCALSYTVTADFGLSVSPSSQTVPSTGGTAAYNITVTALGGFTGTVTYSALTLPSGVSGAITGNVLTLNVAGTATPGTYPIAITGISGSLSHQATATLVISAPAPPSFTIGISPSSVTVHRPGTAFYTVTITPLNKFSGTVTLSASGGKTGVTLSVSPSSITGSGTSTLKATVTTSAKKGNSTLTVTGKSGSITKSASASLQLQ